MDTVLDILEQRISDAMAQVTGIKGCAAIVKPAADSRFGDYQANGVMGLAKQVKANPRKLAEEVVAGLDLSDLCESPEVAGPGFINLRLRPDYIGQRLQRIAVDPARLDIPTASQPKTVVVDFSSPNVAKEMHVGHLRSTIIGDCICRLLEFEGRKVIRQNHIGDWGTQFGKVVLALWHICMAENLHQKDAKPYYDSESLLHLPVNTNITAFFDQIVNRHHDDWLKDSKHVQGDGELYFHPFLEGFSRRSRTLWPALLKAYQYVNLLDESFKGMNRTIETREKNEANQFINKNISYESLTRYITVMLQQGGPDNEQEKKAWEEVRRLTLDECNSIYERLCVQLTDEHVRGESFYNPMLPAVVQDLKNQGMAKESDGAICVFPKGFKTKDGEPLPFIVQKSDGAFLYATTDLAAIRYRVGQLAADRIIYVTDSRQKLHFEMLFATARKADWVPQQVELVHVMFGTVLGEDGAPLKTRSGESVKLKALLDEAVERAIAVVEQKNPDLSADKKTDIAKAVGIGAVKYADYSNNRTSDYVFSFDRMLAMDGNTAPYMQYAYARVRSIERKAVDKGVDVKAELNGIGQVSLTEPDELALAKYLIRYGEAIEAAIADYRPNILTAYLYDLAQRFSSFYNNCPVLDAGPSKRPTRLLLCDLTARTIRHGLGLLGITVVEEM